MPAPPTVATPPGPETFADIFSGLPTGLAVVIGAAAIMGYLTLNTLLALLRARLPSFSTLRALHPRGSLRRARLG